MNKPSKAENAKIKKIIRKVYGKGRKISKKTERKEVIATGRF